MTYAELRNKFIQYEATRPKNHLLAHIVFDKRSWDVEYPRSSRTYEVSSNNKRYQPNKCSNSIWANSLDGTDIGVRLDAYMRDEGVPKGWIVEDCYIVGKDGKRIPATGDERKAPLKSKPLIRDYAEGVGFEIDGNLRPLKVNGRHAGQWFVDESGNEYGVRNSQVTIVSKDGEVI